MFSRFYDECHRSHESLAGAWKQCAAALSGEKTACNGVASSGVDSQVAGQDRHIVKSFEINSNYAKSFEINSNFVVVSILS